MCIPSWCKCCIRGVLSSGWLQKERQADMDLDQGRMLHAGAGPLTTDSCQSSTACVDADEPQVYCMHARSGAARQPVNQQGTTETGAAMLTAGPRAVAVSADVLEPLRSLRLSTEPCSATSALDSSEPAAVLIDLSQLPDRDAGTELQGTHNDRPGHSLVTASKSAFHGVEDEDCTVCWSAASCVIFQPCGHVCCCQVCAQTFVATGALCPICRGAVLSALSI